MKKDSNEVWLWGAGSGCSSFFSIVKEKIGVQVAGIVDSASTKESVCGVRVYPPEIVQTLSGSLFYVCVGDRESSSLIVRDLKKQGHDAIWINDLYEFHIHFPESTDWDSLIPSEPELETVMRMLGDERSRDIVVSTYRSHKQRKFDCYPCSDLSQQYLVTQFTERRRFSHVVKAGGYDGLSAVRIANDTEYIDRMSIIEPCHSLIEKIKNNTKELRNVGKIDIVESAIGEFSGQGEILSFGESSTNNRLEKTETGGLESKGVKVVCIDEEAMFRGMDFLAADIEGYELKMLRGGKYTIIKNLPYMALSIYHCPSHLTRIPLQIFEWCGRRYKYFIRRHTPYNAEMVLYCVPSEWELL